MKSKFWRELYRLPESEKPKTPIVKYPTRKKCEEVATKNGFTIQWDYLGKGKHRVTPDELGEGIAFSTVEVMERITNQ